MTATFHSQPLYLYGFHIAKLLRNTFYDMNTDQKTQFNILKIQSWCNVCMMFIWQQKVVRKVFLSIFGYIDAHSVGNIHKSINVVLIKSLQMEIRIINPIVFRKYSDWLNILTPLDARGIGRSNDINSLSHQMRGAKSPCVPKQS